MNATRTSENALQPVLAALAQAITSAPPVLSTPIVTLLETACASEIGRQQLIVLCMKASAILGVRTVMDRPTTTALNALTMKP